MFRLPSLTSGTQISLTSSETNIPLELKKAEDTLTETESIVESSSREKACNGLMGVPITFLDKFSPDQFEVIGITKNTIGERTENKDLSKANTTQPKRNHTIRNKSKRWRLFNKFQTKSKKALV